MDRRSLRNFDGLFTVIRDVEVVYFILRHLSNLELHWVFLAYVVTDDP